MKVACTRLFTNGHNQSSFEAFQVELAANLPAPPADPLHTASIPANGALWVGTPLGRLGDQQHPAPRKMIFVGVRGDYDVVAGSKASERERNSQHQQDPHRSEIGR